jgi:hypothetical protein
MFTTEKQRLRENKSEEKGDHRDGGDHGVLVVES